MIGKIEGASVITDPAQLPTTFKEAPMLAELVKAGKLPPVAERIGQDPLVLKPLHEIGKYGGTWRRAFTGPGDQSNGVRTTQEDKPLYFDYTGQKIVPNIARGWEVSRDGKVTTRGWRAQFTSPEFSPVGRESVHTARIVPVYHLTAGVTQKRLRELLARIMDRALPGVLDPLAAAERGGLPALDDALRTAHFPEEAADVTEALIPRFTYSLRPRLSPPGSGAQQPFALRELPRQTSAVQIPFYG